MKHRQDFKAIRARADILIKKAEYFDRMVAAKMNKTGSFLKILKEGMDWGTKLAEQPARDRLETKRNNRND